MEEGKREKGEERNVRLKGTNKQLNIKSVYLQVFFSATYANSRLCHMPRQINFSHGYPSKSAWPEADRASLFAMLLSNLASVVQLNHSPQTRRPDTLTQQSGLQALFSDVSSTPNLALVPVQRLAREVEA